MATPYLGEIKIVAFNFPPKGWAFCNGQLEPINQNQALFSLLGTQYGGNGTSTFALPNLQGQVPIHMGQGGGLSSYTIGERAGVENVTLNISDMAQHPHPFQAAETTADATSPSGAFLAKTDVSGNQNFIGFVTALPLNQNAVQPTGGNQPHANQQPTLVLTFCIALAGIFPSRN